MIDFKKLYEREKKLNQRLLRLLEEIAPEKAAVAKQKIAKNPKDEETTLILTKQDLGNPCDREYINLLKDKAAKLRSEITLANLPIKDCSLCHMRNAANEIRNSILELEKAYEMYGEEEW